MGNLQSFKNKRWTKTEWGSYGWKCRQDLGKMCAGSGTHMGNPHGTHMKKVDKNRIGPIWVIMRAISGQNVGRIWDPYGQPIWDLYETGAQKPYGAHMGGNAGKM